MRLLSTGDLSRPHGEQNSVLRCLWKCSVSQSQSPWLTLTKQHTLSRFGELISFLPAKCFFLSVFNLKLLYFAFFFSSLSLPSVLRQPAFLSAPLLFFFFSIYIPLLYFLFFHLLQSVPDLPLCSWLGAAFTVRPSFTLFAHLSLSRLFCLPPLALCLHIL